MLRLLRGDWRHARVCLKVDAPARVLRSEGAWTSSREAASRRWRI